MSANRCGAVLSVVCCIAIVASFASFGTDSVDAALAGLHGLPFAQFLDASYREILLRNPESVTAMGLSQLLGTRDDRLTDLSPAYVLETQRLESGVLDLLRNYDRSAMSDEAGLWYDVYNWLLETTVAAHSFAFHDYPLNGFLSFGAAGSLYDLFTASHPLETPGNVEDYIARLRAVPSKVAGIIQAVRHRESLGVRTPGFLLESALRVICDLLGPGSAYRTELTLLNVGRSEAYQRFAGAVESLDILSGSQRADFLADGLEAFDESYMPALWDLKVFVEELIPDAPEEGGATHLPSGDALFALQLQRQTSTALSAQEIHDLGVVQVNRVLQQTRDAFCALGYDRNAPLAELWEELNHADRRLSSETPYGRGQILEEFERIYEETNEAIAPYFGLWPSDDVAFAFSPSHVTINYYNAPALDGSRPGTFYISGTGTSLESMPVTFHHEAVPGHHFQLTIALSLDLPLLLRVIDINAYVEGWALYCERLAFDLGLYADRPYANLRRLEVELQRAARLVVDTGIHWLGWTRERAAAYIEELRGLPSGAFIPALDRYYVLPGQASSYMIGKLKIEELRGRAEAELGDAFDLAEFHDAVLGHGVVPLDNLEGIVDRYIRNASI